MEQHLKIVFVVILFSLVKVNASPFELTENYINNFKKGLGDLKDISTNYKYEQLDLLNGEENKTEATPDPIEFDFIVIGSGASGSVIASRLSEVPEWKVLLLEAGATETEISKVPAMKPYLATTPYDWSYTTTTQKKSCLGMEDQKCSVPSAQALGGTTAVDDMLLNRGNPQDYDMWADLGLPEWCWRDLFPYFKKIEDAHIPELDRKYHNLGGPVHLEHFQNPSDLQKHILEAGQEVGLKTVDFNGKEQLGLGIPQATTKNGKRNSVAQSYLAPAHKRTNLEVRPASQVVQILIKPHTKEAYGVKYLHDGKLFVAKAAKEIILSAGAIESPKLLMLSGIGPKETLESLGIEPLADLKVGHNLKDHLAFIGLNFILNGTGTHEDDKYDEVVDYLKNGKGPLTNPGIEVQGFIKTKASKDTHPGYPDVELQFRNGIYNKGPEHIRSLRIKKEVYDAVWKPIEGAKGFTIQVILLHPKSTGTVTLHDKDPLHHPLIDTQALTDIDDQDMETLLAGVHDALKLAHSESLHKVGIELNHNKLPECQNYEKDEYWKCAIKHLSVNLGSVSGTVKMGKKPEEGGCVDDKLKVHGVQKLRVADASVIPVGISGHLSGANLVIGEKAADMIKHDWE